MSRDSWIEAVTRSRLDSGRDHHRLQGERAEHFLFVGGEIHDVQSPRL